MYYMKYFVDRQTLGDNYQKLKSKSFNTQSYNRHNALKHIKLDTTSIKALQILKVGLTK